MPDSYENVPHGEPKPDVPRWAPAANVPRWQPPVQEASVVISDDDAATRRAPIARVSPLSQPFDFWRVHPWLVVWLCVFLAPVAVVLLRLADEWGFEGLVAPLQWALHGSIHGVQERSDHAGTVEALIEAGAPVPSDPGETSNAVREVLGRYNRRG